MRWSWTKPTPGENTRGLKAVLAAKTLEEAAKEEEHEGEDLEDRIVAEMKKRGRSPNVSYFVFTATPKPKNMELFGTPRADCSFAPFGLIPCGRLSKRASSRTCWRTTPQIRPTGISRKKVKVDPRYERRKAYYLLKRFVDLHEHSIRKKVEIMLQHFAGQVMHRVGGKAKAMIVTRSLRSPACSRNFSAEGLCIAIPIDAHLWQWRQSGF